MKLQNETLGTLKRQIRNYAINHGDNENGFAEVRMKVPSESLVAIKRQIREYIVEPKANTENCAEVKITTARELPDSEFQEIVKNLSQKFGKKVVAERRVDKNILGGIIIQHGDKVIDGSVASQLKQYNKMMSKFDIKKIGVTSAV
jgi:ATP synthase F1 delta subunit